MTDQSADITAMLLAKQVTRIHGRPERHEVDNLEKEVAQIVSTAKTTRFLQGDKYGHLVMIVGETQYRTIIGDASFIFTIPTDEGAYDTTNIVGTVATTAAAKAQAEAVHTRHQNEYYRWTAVESAARQLIIGAIDPELLVELEDEWVRYEGHTPAEIIKFIRDSVCLQATTEDQLALQAKLFEPWDQTKNLLSYFKKLDLAQKAMKNAHVPCEDGAKAIQAGSQMAASGMFSERQVTTWEEKPHTDKTWANLKTYYARIYKSKIQYTKNEARRAGHESVNAMRDNEAAIETQLNSYLETAHETAQANTEELNALREGQNVFVKLGEQLMSQMKVQQDLINKMAAQLEEEKSQRNPSTRTPRNRNAAQKPEKHECPTCKMMCLHKPENCPEINEAKRWNGWTSRL